MNIQTLLTSLQLREDKDWEFKAGKGGLPRSLWETYSAMANTDGGVIVLGVKERDGEGFEVQGLDDAARFEKDFWNTINNRSHVSANLLTNSDVRVEAVGDKRVLVIQVPRAARRQRPVFVGQNPLDGTYRRFHEGDYKCPPDEVGRMLADRSDDPADARVLPHFSEDDLDPESLRQYRRRLASRAPAHPWLTLEDRGLLEKLGGRRTDRVTGESGLTVAGLLMFGKDEAIRDPASVPQYHVDYRERLSDDPQVRWTDRVWPDGTWVANLFQFFERVYPRLVGRLKIPFRLVNPEHAPLFQRHDETIVHEALREAFVNSLIHADYRGQGGLVVEQYRDRLVFSNAGTLLLGLDQMLKGGVSECRNKLLQGMFAMLGYGERAGSGIDKIRQGWASQNWQAPRLAEFVLPDRVELTLPMVSLLPEQSLTRLSSILGAGLNDLNAAEVQALVTADMEGSVSNPRLQQFLTDHSTHITRMLQDLVGKGLLVKDGYGRWASYRLAKTAKSGTVEAAAVREGSSSHNDPSSSHNDPSSSHNDPSSSHNDPSSIDPELVAIAAPARAKGRLPPDVMRRLIRELCGSRYLTIAELGALLKRNPVGVRTRFLAEMVEDGQLLARHPEPTHPDQAYRTNPDWREA